MFKIEFPFLSLPSSPWGILKVQSINILRSVSLLVGCDISKAPAKIRNRIYHLLADTIIKLAISLLYWNELPYNKLDRRLSWNRL